MMYFWKVPITAALPISGMAGFGGDAIVRLALLLYKKLISDTFYRVFNLKEKDDKKTD
jgi:hypothetical protein